MPLINSILKKSFVVRSKPSAATYTVTSNVATVSEGNAVAFNITTRNVPSNTRLYYTLANMTGADISGGSASGNTVINDNQGTAVVNVANDFNTEGSETMIFQLRTGSINGTVVANSSVTILDTSLTVFPFEYLVVAGGGGGGGIPYQSAAGGGGAGGYRYGTANLNVGTYTVIVGAGGVADYWGSSGSNSNFGNIVIATGGGLGSRNGTVSGEVGAGGGSGGGGQPGQVGGAGNAGSYTPAEGYAGGTGANAYGGGGGGAANVGYSGSHATLYSVGGPGSNLHATWATATGTGDNGYYAGGGGGGRNISGGGPAPGGPGGGGTGGYDNNYPSGGMANTGGGGGGGSHPIPRNPGPGGSGIVILRNQGAQIATGGNVFVSGGYNYHVFLSSGNLTIT